MQSEFKAIAGTEGKINVENKSEETNEPNGKEVDEVEVEDDSEELEKEMARFENLKSMSP